MRLPISCCFPNFHQNKFASTCQLCKAKPKCCMLSVCKWPKSHLTRVAFPHHPNIGGCWPFITPVFPTATANGILLIRHPRFPLFSVSTSWTEWNTNHHQQPHFWPTIGHSSIGNTRPTPNSPKAFPLPCPPSTAALAGLCFEHESKWMDGRWMAALPRSPKRSRHVGASVLVRGWMMVAPSTAGNDEFPFCFPPFYPFPPPLGLRVPQAKHGQ